MLKCNVPPGNFQSKLLCSCALAACTKMSCIDVPNVKKFIVFGYEPMQCMLLEKTKR